MYIYIYIHILHRHTHTHTHTHTHNRDDVMELIGLLTPEQAQSLMQQMSQDKGS